MLSHPFKRLFSVDEANALLPVVTPLLERMREDYRTLLAARVDLANMTPEMRSNGHAADAARIDRVIATCIARMEVILTALTDFGIELKEIETGLIDFPAVRDGRIVYLCWRLGEGNIAYWHELDAGYAGRRALGTDSVGD